MKYLLKFFESNQDFGITDRDLELIENCFLDYIEQTHLGEFTPRSCEIQWQHEEQNSKNYVQIRFYIPLATHEEIRDIVNLKPGPKAKSISKLNDQYLDAQDYLSWKWSQGFIEEITGDIKRCESYGFDCRFDFLISHNPSIWLQILKKPNSSTSYTLEEAYEFTKEKTKTTLMKYVQTFNESTEVNQFFTSKEINLIEDIFIDFEKKIEFQYFTNKGWRSPKQETTATITASFTPTGEFSLHITRDELNSEYGHVNYSRIWTGDSSKTINNSDVEELDNFFKYKQDTLLDYLEKNYRLKSDIYHFFSRIKGLEYYKFKWEMNINYIIRDIETPFRAGNSKRGFDISIYIYLSISK